MQLLKTTHHHTGQFFTESENIDCDLPGKNTDPEQIKPQTAQKIISCETANSYIPKTNMQIDKDTFLNTLLDGHRKFSERRKVAATGDEFDDKNLEAVCRILGRMIAYELQNDE
jgi:hypothetical protein